MDSITAQLLTAAGGIWTSYQLWKLATFVYLHFVRRGTLSRYNRSQNSDGGASWALITGASDGIGKGFAEELCHRGFDVVLHGRNEAKLNAVKDTLMRQWPRRDVRIMVIDAGSEAGDTSKVQTAVHQLRDINLTVLVNNVGGAGGIKPTWVSLDKRTSTEITLFMDLNMRFPTEITRQLLPQLTRAKSALIINVGSAAGNFPTPYLSVYSGSKAYNNAWSRSLRAEMIAEGHDVEVLCLLVGMVSTGSLPKATNLFCPSSRRLAQSSLDVVGCGRNEIWAYWPHALQFGLIGLLPEWLMMRTVTGIARKGKAHEEREAKQS